jgi:cytochrome c biogenesis protein CcdA
MLWRLFFYLAMVLGLWLLAFEYHLNYSFEDFKEYTNILLNASGMVFTLMGIWIAFLYPNALSRIVNPEKIKTADFSESLEETKRLESIVSSVLKSAAVVLFIMLIYLAKVIFYRQAMYLEHAELIKCLALALVAVLSYIQAEAIWHVAYSNVMFINDLHHKREDREADADV